MNHFVFEFWLLEILLSTTHCFYEQAQRLVRKVAWSDERLEENTSWYLKVWIKDLIQTPSNTFSNKRDGICPIGFYEGRKSRQKRRQLFGSTIATSVEIIIVKNLLILKSKTVKLKKKSQNLTKSQNWGKSFE